MSGRIVVVEDEQLTRTILINALQQAGFSVRAAADAEACRAALRAEPADLVVLDLGLPGQDGQSYAKELRKESDVSVLIVTARSNAEVETLNDGADGFLRKPVEPTALIAHVNAMLRRRHAPSEAEFSFGSWSVDLKGRVLRKADGDIQTLTRGEFNLLALLVRAQGRIVSRELLSEAVNRGSRTGDEFGDLRSVDALVSRLRRKLGSEIIGTAPGFGYRLAIEVRNA
jgi:DNA-binding response OmpR family regulator